MVSSKSVFKKLKNSKLNTFENKISKLFKNYKNLVLVKNKYLENNSIKSNKYIVFLDTALYDHPSIKNKIQINRKIFFRNLRKNLSFMQKYFNKKVIVCAHPKNNRKRVYKDFSGFKVKFYETEKYSSMAFLITFFTSISVLNGIANDKPIIQFKDQNLNNFWKIEVKLWFKTLNCVQLNLNEKINSSKLKFLHFNAVKKIVNYNKLKKNILSFERKSAIDVLLNLK
jgi:hypothetical protein